MTAKYIALNDRAALNKIRLNGGVVWVGADGEPYLNTYSQVSKRRFQRLLELGLLKPGSDGMFGAQPQTYHLSEELNV